MRDALAVAEAGRWLLLKLDGATPPEDLEPELRAVYRLAMALEVLDKLDAATAPGCWRATIASRA